ncbi:MAG: glycosyltransferase family 4 protein [Elusimicrobia bacterium]|nr:glycosyltransferase family 4 protein [Elusimicrobiota bacterium]
MLTVAHLDSARTVLLYGKTNDPDGKIMEFIETVKMNIKQIPELVRDLNLVSDTIAFIKIYLFIRKNRFDIVHTHSSKAGILGRWAAFFAGVKVIIHTPHGHVFSGYFGKLKSSFFVFIERMTALITDRIITLTEKGIDDHVMYGIGPRKKFVAIHSGVNTDELTDDKVSGKAGLLLRKELGLIPGKIVVGTVSRLDPVKGNIYFVRAIKELMNMAPEIYETALFILVGDGEQRELLESMVKEYGISDKVIFTGMRNDVSLIIPLFDIFVLASLMEGMGKVFIKAMVNAKPVIGTAVGGVPEIIEDGVSGILVPPKDPVALAGACARLISDEKLRKSMGAAGKKHVNELVDGHPRYSVEAMMNKLDRLYDGYMREGPG